MAIRGIFFDTTTTYVTDQMVQTLLCPFSSSEVLWALKSLGSEVYSREDGLTGDVFLQYWDIIADDLTGAMQEEWKEGLICLIPKGDH